MLLTFYCAVRQLITEIAEIKSICLTMVSAGLDTVPGNLIMGIAYLASQDGQRIQQKAYDATK